MQARRYSGQAAAPGAVERADRTRRALELRRDGLSYPAIAERIGVSLGQAHADVQAGLKRIGVESAETAIELRSIELARLDRVVELATKAAEGGDVRALGVILRAIEVRAKLLGLDERADEPPVVDPVDVIAKLRAKLDRADSAAARIASV